MNIIKRDGRTVEFNKKKIIDAVMKAYKSINSKYDDSFETFAESLADKIEWQIKRNLNKEYSVEDIQDIIEEHLMGSRFKSVAKAYIVYREDRTKARKNTIDEVVNEIVNSSSDYWNNENSNKDAKLATTQRDYIAGAVSTDETRRFLLPKDVVEAHDQGIIHFHDMDYFISSITNCCLINLEDMLQNGTVISNVKIDRPHKFSTACNIATQIIAQVASSQYGGQSVSLAHLSPFIEETRKNFKKIYPRFDDDQIERLVEKDIEAGVQTLQYQIVTLMTTNGQAPFITLYMNLGEISEGKQREDLAKAIEEVLKQRKKGVKNEKGVYVTPAFPKLIYALDDFNTYEDSPYFYLTKLSAECTAKRLVPDYISNKVQRNIKSDDNYPCMGCVDGEEVIDYKSFNERHVESFKRVWNRLSVVFPIKRQPNGKDEYMDTEGVTIWDTKEQKYVPMNRMIRNHADKWYEMSFSNGRILNCTPDHPFETDHGVKHANELTSEDVILIDTTAFQFSNTGNTSIINAWCLGLLLCDGCYEHNVTVSLGADEQDVAKVYKRIASNMFGLPIEQKEQDRGRKGHYLDLLAKTSKGKPVRDVCNQLKALFGGTTKATRKIPDFIFNSSKDVRLAFLAGMIDADGYINNSQATSKVQIGSTNKELALQQMLLAQSLGMRAFVYRNHYTANNHDNIRYRVEFIPNDGLIDHIVSTKKLNNIGNNVKKHVSIADTNTCVLMSKTEKPVTVSNIYSYDVTTESGHFGVSGMYSHNCRSFLTVDRSTENYAGALNYDAHKGHKYYGRFNQGVVTINLVDVALSSGGNLGTYWKILNERLDICHKALRCRHNRLLGTKSDIAPILWQYGAYARLQKGEVIDKLLYHGYSTISLGYAGLYECSLFMIGKSHTSKEGKEFALKTMQVLNDACDKWKQEEDIDYSVYGTPLESTTYKFAKCLQKRFGKIKDITDHEYITNSYHVNVRENIDAFTKLKLESEFQRVSPGGAISYVEVPDLTQNTDAVLKVVQYIYENIMYAELNCKSDYCQKCGYSGEIKIKGEEGNLYWECPNCGNTDNNTLNVARRSCGYIGTNFWNQGRTSEIKDRVLHLDNMGKL